MSAHEATHLSGAIRWHIFSIHLKYFPFDSQFGFAHPTVVFFHFNISFLNRLLISGYWGRSVPIPFVVQIIIVIVTRVIYAYLPLTTPAPIH